MNPLDPCTVTYIISDNARSRRGHCPGTDSIEDPYETIPGPG